MYSSKRTQHKMYGRRESRYDWFGRSNSLCAEWIVPDSSSPRFTTDWAARRSCLPKSTVEGFVEGRDDGRGIGPAGNVSWRLRHQLRDFQLLFTCLCLCVALLCTDTAYHSPQRGRKNKAAKWVPPESLSSAVHFFGLGQRQVPIRNKPRGGTPNDEEWNTRLAASSSLHYNQGENIHSS